MADKRKIMPLLVVSGTLLFITLFVGGIILLARYPSQHFQQQAFLENPRPIPDLKEMQ